MYPTNSLSPLAFPRVTVMTAIAFVMFGVTCPSDYARAATADRPVRLADRWLPVDQDGWTILKPSQDSRIVYVSSSDGDDATGATSPAADPSVGQDPTRPAGQVKPLKTIAKALAQLRDGHPDWLLLKRGDVWNRETISVGIGHGRTGRSAREPMVFGSYGDAPQRPMLKMDWTTPGIAIHYTGWRHLVFAGLEFYAWTRDPESPDYYVPPGKRMDGAFGLIALPQPERPAENLLVEDCVFRFCMVKVGRHPKKSKEIEGLVVRRCQYLDGYVPASGHMGLGGGLLEENLFDHVGWSEDAKTYPLGKANMLVHSTYCADLNGAVFRGNMFLRSSSIGTKFTASATGSSAHVVLDDNLFVEGEIGISMGGNEYLPFRFVRPVITNNVMLDLGRARPTGRDLGWGLGIENWDGGLVANNLFLHQTSDKVRNAYAIYVRAAGTRNVLIRDNVIHGLDTRSAGIVLGECDALSREIVLQGNLVQFPGLRSMAVCVEGNTEGYRLLGNTYFSGLSAEKWFGIRAKPSTPPAAVGLEEFLRRTGEKDAKAAEIRFPDPGRTVERYHESLGGRADLLAFIAEARKQSKGNWRPQYTARAVNEWIRAGLGRKYETVEEDCGHYR